MTREERSDLYWALRTRVVTEEEMLQVRKIGTALVIDPYLSGNPDARMEFNDALFKQSQLRFLQSLKDMIQTGMMK
jgi:hypothetical protein